MKYPKTDLKAITWALVLAGAAAALWFISKPKSNK